MFERFTDRARRVVVLSQEETRNLGHRSIETEHVLLGLIGEGEGVAALALTNLGFSTEFIRDRVIERHGASLGYIPSGHLPFTPETKKTLEGALREALQLGHNYIGTEHILLGVLRSDSMACEILEEKTERKAIRTEIIRILGAYAAASTPQAPPPRNVVESIILCTAELDQLESARHRAAVLAFLTSWYAREVPS